MEVAQVLHMNGGLGETSYANNSLVQRKVMSITKPLREEAISQVFCNLAPSPFCIADLGCSTGSNTMVVVAELVKTVHQLCWKQGRQSPEFQILLNDLPANDFNSIFQSLLPNFQSQLNRELERQSGFSPGSPPTPHCFVYGAPGSFYGRLFAANSLHFVHSSYSLMWLSKVPEGMEIWNNDNIYIGSKSTTRVINAYYDQFRRDFNTFLKCRSEEMIVGGQMVLTILGRKSESGWSKECCHIWELLALSLKELVSEGVIEEEKLHSFNIPQYRPSPEEVRKEVEEEGSFTINHLEASEIRWAESCGIVGGDDGYHLAKCMRSVAEPMLVQHFGKTMIERLFEIYRKMISDHMSKEDTNFVNVTLSVIRTATS